MSNTAKKKKPTADEIAEMAMSGEDVSRFFTNKGEMRPPVQRVNVDFAPDMLKELDAVVRELNISRQAVIKAYLRQALDQHYIARLDSVMSSCQMLPLFHTPPYSTFQHRN